MAAKNKCYARWSDSAGSNWHHCNLPAGHKGPHTNPGGKQPMQGDRVYEFDSWGKQAKDLGVAKADHTTD